jgi:hypothetical protein
MRGPSTMRRMTPNIALNLTAQERRSCVTVALRASPAELGVRCLLLCALSISQMDLSTVR